MRWRDLIGLALFALSRHKVRSLLTTLGVLFGTLVLAVSLSIRQGVQDTIVREVSKHVELRRIEVHPRPGGATEPPPITGKMSEERRRRLQEELRQRRGSQDHPQTPLTPALLKQITQLEHVTAAHPTVHQNGRVLLNDRGQYTMLLGLPSGMEELFRRRIVAGSMLSAEDSGGALISEYLLYELGFVDEQAMHQAIGQPLTFEVRLGGRPQAGLLVPLLTGGGGDSVGLGEENVLGKVLKRLPDSLDRLGLTPAELDSVRRLLRQASKSATKEEVYQATYQIKGVLRAPLPDEPRRRGDWMLRYTGLIVSPEAAESFYLRLPQAKQRGFYEVVVEVDEMDNVKAVQAQVRELGVNANSAIDVIEREQFTYLLVFTGMSVVALTALLVAALGITNTMLMSVLERVREIGICKAVGARDRHILMTFLVEGGLIGVVGGVLGLLAAWGVSYPANAWLQAQVSQRMNLNLDRSLFAFPWWLVLGTPLFAIAVTTLAAVYPARRAVGIDPVQALRHE